MGTIRKKKEAGFTLIELLVTLLIVGILAAGAGAVYLGYVKDAKTAEGKGWVGALWTALQGCAQAAPTTACTTAGQYGRLGLNAGGLTPDGRWTLTGASLTMDNAGVYTLGAAGLLSTGTAADIAGIVITMKYTNGNTPPGTLTCLIPPAATASPC